MFQYANNNNNNDLYLLKGHSKIAVKIKNPKLGHRQINQIFMFSMKASLSLSYAYLLLIK